MSEKRERGEEENRKWNNYKNQKPGRREHEEWRKVEEIKIN